MLVLFVSEIPALLGMSECTSSLEALEEVWKRNEPLKIPFTKKYLQNQRYRAYEKEEIVVKKRELVSGLLVVGRVVVTKGGTAVLMRRRKQDEAEEIQEEDRVCCEWYSWLFATESSMLEVNVVDGDQGYVEKEIRTNMHTFNQDKDALIDLLNKTMISPCSHSGKEGSFDVIADE